MKKNHEHLPEHPKRDQKNRSPKQFAIDPNANQGGICRATPLNHAAGIADASSQQRMARVRMAALTFKRFGADRAAPMAASIAFYSAFSLAPTLVMGIAVAGLVFGAEAARGQLFHQINGMLGKGAAASVQAIVGRAHQSGGSSIAAMMSFLLLAVGASATFSSLNTALTIVWQQRDKEASGIAMLVEVRPISFGLVMGVAFLLIASLVQDTGVQAAGK